MTVSYTAKVATSSFACFLRLLARWKGSVYKLMWKEFLIFGGIYFSLNVVYRFALKDDQKKIFEEVSEYCEKHSNLIPVAFILGFYVTIAVNRWWSLCCTIPWPSRMAIFVTAHLHGHDERGRLMRRTLMRYLSLSYVITMSSISPQVKRRFPTWTHMTEAGFMTPEEQKIINNIKTPYNMYFVPLAWCTSIVSLARKEGRIKDDFAVITLIDEINIYRGQLGSLFNFDWISIPLVYTQTVTLSVYTFFLSCLMGRQYLESSETIDVYVPWFTFLQFMAYMGWLKVAETLVNPMGEDDDDFELNVMIDNNLQLAYLVVDGMHAEHPQLIKDQYWESVQFDLPYTAGSVESKDKGFHMGSAFGISVSPKEAEFVSMSSIHDDSLNRSSSTKLKDRIFSKSIKRKGSLKDTNAPLIGRTSASGSPRPNDRQATEGQNKDNTTETIVQLENITPKLERPRSTSPTMQEPKDSTGTSPPKHDATDPFGLFTNDETDVKIATSSPKSPRAEGSDQEKHDLQTSKM